MNLNSTYFKGVAYVNNYIPFLTNNDTNFNNKVTIVGLARYFWVPQYVFEKLGHYYENWDRYIPPVTTNKILFVIPWGNITDMVSGSDQRALQLHNIYNRTHIVAIFDPGSVLAPDKNLYPYTSLKESQTPQKIEVRANYKGLGNLTDQLN
jgi:hypothetical protein